LCCRPTFAWCAGSRPRGRSHATADFGSYTLGGSMSQRGFDMAQFNAYNELSKSMSAQSTDPDKSMSAQSIDPDHGRSANGSSPTGVNGNANGQSPRPSRKPFAAGNEGSGNGNSRRPQLRARSDSATPPMLRQSSQASIREIEPHEQSDHKRYITEEIPVNVEVEDHMRKVLMQKSMRALPKGTQPLCTRIASCNISGVRVKHVENSGMARRRPCCSVKTWCNPGFFGPEKAETFSLLAPINWWYFIMFEWTMWGRGEPSEMRDQLMTQMTNISLVAALLFTVAAAFLLNLITPDGIGNLNFPIGTIEDSNDALGGEKVPATVDWWILNLFVLSTCWLLMSTLTAMFLMMAAKEVGDAESVGILINWFGNWIKFPTIAFVVGTFLFLVGLIMWLSSIYTRDASWQMSIAMVVMFAVPLMWPTTIFCLTVSRSVWLTLSRGHKNVYEGHTQGQQIQSITVKELQQQLDEYIEDAGGVENITLATYKDRLRITQIKDHDQVEWDATEHHDVIKLGLLTERLCEKLFHTKIEEACEEAEFQPDKTSVKGINRKCVQPDQTGETSSGAARRSSLRLRSKEEKEIESMKRALDEVDPKLKRLNQYASKFVQNHITTDQVLDLPWEALMQLGLPIGHVALIKNPKYIRADL